MFYKKSKKKNHLKNFQMIRKYFSFSLITLNIRIITLKIFHKNYYSMSLLRKKGVVKKIGEIYKWQKY